MKTVTRTVLIADEGMVLTNGENYGKVVSLEVGGDASLWREISEEEHEKLIESEGLQ